MAGVRGTHSPESDNKSSSPLHQSSEQSHQAHAYSNAKPQSDPCIRIVSDVLQKIPVFPPIEGVSASKMVCAAVHAAHEANADEEQLEIVARLFTHIFSEGSLSDFEEKLRESQTVDSIHHKLDPLATATQVTNNKSYVYLDFILRLTEIATLRATRVVEDLRALNGSKMLSLAVAMTKQDVNFAIGRNDVTNGLPLAYADLHGKDNSNSSTYDKFISIVAEDVKLGEVVHALSEVWGLSMLLFLPSYALESAKLIPTKILKCAIRAVVMLHPDMGNIFKSLQEHYLIPVTAGQPLSTIRFVFEPQSLRRRWRIDEGVSFARLIQVTAQGE